MVKVFSNPNMSHNFLQGNKIFCFFFFFDIISIHLSITTNKETKVLPYFKNLLNDKPLPINTRALNLDMQFTHIPKISITSDLKKKTFLFPVRVYTSPTNRFHQQHPDFEHISVFNCFHIHHFRFQNISKMSALRTLLIRISARFLHCIYCLLWVVHH